MKYKYITQKYTNIFYIIYILQLRPGLRMIAINSNFCNNLNLWLVPRPRYLPHHLYHHHHHHHHQHSCHPNYHHCHNDHQKGSSKPTSMACGSVRRCKFFFLFSLLLDMPDNLMLIDAIKV